MNLFRYCGDDPVDRSDPTGLMDRSASGSTIEERMRLFYGDSGRGSLSELDHRDQGFTMASQSKAESGQTGPEYRTPRAAANSRITEVGQAITTQKETEYASEVGERRDKDGLHYVAITAHPGLGTGYVNNGKVKGQAQRSLIDQNNLPHGYRIVGFVLGHVFRDSRKAAADLQIAREANYMIAIIVNPKPSGAHDYPLDIYSR
jgi:hypothetical protein